MYLKKKHNNIFAFSIILQQWNVAVGQTPSYWKAKARLSCIVNTMVVDGDFQEPQNQQLWY